MPWSVEKRGKQFCVVKTTTRKVVPGGCHPTMTKASAHAMAIRINYKKGKKK